MDGEGIIKPGSDSQGLDEPVPTGNINVNFNKSAINIPRPSTANPNVPATPTVGFKLTPSSKGVENAKKRLRAFSIQKKTPITPVTVTKGTGGGSTTVFIGKLCGVKTTPKSEDVDQKKQPKPPKPGYTRKILQDSYTELQKRTLTEIEDMKRKMELVELGIPLGLICPTNANDKAMPTKAMPPIKSLLDPAKLDEIIREAKKAKAEGREFKFDYQKILPDYDNPFQRKKEECEKTKSFEEKEYRKKIEKERDKEKDKRKYEKYDKDARRHPSHKKDEKRKDDREKHKDKIKDKEDKKNKEQRPLEVKRKVQKVSEKETKETDVNLSDYLVCDSWSLDNEDKTGSASPKLDDKIKKIPVPIESKPAEITKEVKKGMAIDNPLSTPVRNIEKLQPVMDLVKYEIEPNEDEILDMFDENSQLEKFALKTLNRSDDIYDSPMDMKMFDFDQNTKESSNDALIDDKFLESVINEIKQEDMTDEDSRDKGLVEYDSPSRDSESPPIDSRLCVTPELDDRMRDLQSSRTDYSDGYRSTESGYKSTESGYKSNASYKSGDSKGDNYRMSMEKDLGSQLNKSTVDSLETWSFVLKICQPLLFRHDKNKCYRETRTVPKIWFTENPKLCNCVKDRAVVYEELEACKMSLVDRVYGCDQIPEVMLPKTRTWYPRFAHCLMESSAVPSLIPASDWEADDSQTETTLMKDKRRSTTPLRSEEIYLDREYQRFMQAVWPEATESKAGTPRSTTPVRQEARKKKAEDKETEDKKKAKKIKLSSEGWSQESDIEEEIEKSKQKLKPVKVKVRKRKHSTSSVSESDDTAKKRRKALKKKAKESKKTKLKLTKRRRLSKKYLKKLKEKQKKKKKHVSEDEDMEKEKRKKEKKLRKKKLQKKKKAQRKKKAKVKSSSSSSSSTSTSTSSTSSSSESEPERRKKKKSEVNKKKRKQSSSDSTQSEELFDVNILKNIKTERLTDDEKCQKLVEFSPRRQKPREIINVKELQNDFVGNNIHIKQEVEEKEIVVKTDLSVKCDHYELDSQEKEFATERAPDIPDVPEVPNEPETKEEVLCKEIPLPLITIAKSDHKDTEVIASNKLPDICSTSSSADKDIPLPLITPAQSDHKDIEVAATNKLVDTCSTSSSVEKEIPLPLITPAQSHHKVTEVAAPNKLPVNWSSSSLADKELPKHNLTQKEQVATNKLLDNSSTSPSVDKEIPLPLIAPAQSHHKLTEVAVPNKLPVNWSSSSLADKESQELINIPIPQLGPLPEESNLSQCSSQESSTSKEHPYEKDDSHLRPSSQNSNYSFNDVISASQIYQKDEDDTDKFHDTYEQGNYEIYEQLAMAYQSDVAKQTAPSLTAGDPFFVSQRIETVVRTRSRGEIKCDWRAGDDSAAPTPSSSNQRPSRWGLKPSEVNIILTGGGEDFPIHSVAEPVYKIQTIANRSENNTTGSYDEAYEDMYGASDRLQYGDCFKSIIEPRGTLTADNGASLTHSSSLDERINRALRTTVLSEVRQDVDETDGDKDGPEKGILMSKALSESRGAKRVSFADGYKPGQDSDVEEPPVKKKKKTRRFGCAWPCPASHPDHVPLWDALPPPPPPPGSPPPNIHQVQLLPPQMNQPSQMMQPPQLMQQPPQMMQQPPPIMQQPPQIRPQPSNMMQSQIPNMLQPPNMMQQPPQMMPQPNMMQPQNPNMLQPQNMLQQPPNIMQHPPNMLQQPPNMLQPPAQMLQQQSQMLQQQGIKSLISASPFSMSQKMDSTASLQNFLPPEPPPGILNFS